jgi:hypothetical protein
VNGGAERGSNGGGKKKKYIIVQGRTAVRKKRGVGVDSRMFLSAMRDDIVLGSLLRIRTINVARPKMETLVPNGWSRCPSRARYRCLACSGVRTLTIDRPRGLLRTRADFFVCLGGKKAIVPKSVLR